MLRFCFFFVLQKLVGLYTINSHICEKYTVQLVVHDSFSAFLSWNLSTFIQIHAETPMCAVLRDYFLVQKHTVLASSSSKKGRCSQCVQEGRQCQSGSDQGLLLGIRLHFQPANQWQSVTKHQGHAWCLNSNK